MIQLSDVRDALRLWRRHPTLVVVAGLSLGLGVGATTTMYSVVNRVAHYELGFADVDRLVVLSNTDTTRGNNQQPVPFELMRAILENSRSFEGFGLFQTGPAPVTLSTSQDATRVGQMPVDVAACRSWESPPCSDAPTGSRTSTTRSSRRKRAPSSSATRPGRSVSAESRTRSGRRSASTARPERSSG